MCTKCFLLLETFRLRLISLNQTDPEELPRQKSLGTQALGRDWGAVTSDKPWKDRGSFTHGHLVPLFIGCVAMNWSFNLFEPELLHLLRDTIYLQDWYENFMWSSVTNV